MSEVTRVRQQLGSLEKQLEKMLREIEDSDEYKEDLFSDLLYAKDKVIEAMQFLRGRE